MEFLGDRAKLPLTFLLAIFEFYHTAQKKKSIKTLLMSADNDPFMFSERIFTKLSTFIIIS